MKPDAHFRVLRIKLMQFIPHPLAQLDSGSDSELPKLVRRRMHVREDELEKVSREGAKIDAKRDVAEHHKARLRAGLRFAPTEVPPIRRCLSKIASKNHLSRSVFIRGNGALLEIEFVLSIKSFF